MAGVLEDTAFLQWSSYPLADYAGRRPAKNCGIPVICVFVFCSPILRMPMQRVEPQQMSAGLCGASLTCAEPAGADRFIPHEATYGAVPSVVYQEHEGGHGVLECFVPGRSWQSFGVGGAAEEELGCADSRVPRRDGTGHGASWIARIVRTRCLMDICCYRGDCCRIGHFAGCSG